MKVSIQKRFGGLFPVVVDLETSGLNSEIHALLEIAAIPLCMNFDGSFSQMDLIHEHIEPFPGSHIDAKALELNRIIPMHPFRFALSEKEALTKVFEKITQLTHQFRCRRAILVGHNPFFDLGFLNVAILRHRLKSPFHHFTTFDTATLSGLAFGETVLAKACLRSGLGFDVNEAHSAIYDAQKTADLFCNVMNSWLQLTHR